jgi:hypothetical protein
VAKKKEDLPFDRRGGVIVFGKRMVNSSQYLKLPAQAKVLLILLQDHWRNTRPIDYGIREAMKKIPCSKGTAQKAFKLLENGGFIEKIDESLFNSRTMSKSRTWRLTWLPYKGRPPTNEWEEVDSTGPNSDPVKKAQGQK